MQSNRYVIVQFPNKSLWTMIGAWLVGRFSSGSVFSFAGTVFYVAGIIWAYQEITTGVNLFRKILGLVVLVVMGYGIFKTMR